jgi:hypothetical protein
MIDGYYFNSRSTGRSPAASTNTTICVYPVGSLALCFLPPYFMYSVTSLRSPNPPVYMVKKMKPKKESMTRWKQECV